MTDGRQPFSSTQPHRREGNHTTKYILGIDSGAVKNNLLCQMQADILGIPVIRPKNHEATIYGAMLLAGLSTGIYSSLDELSGMWSVERVFEPQLSKDEADGLYSGWLAARELTKGWTKKLPQ